MVVGSDSVAHQTPVTTGIVSGPDTQIVSGLSAGRQVVTTGVAGLDDGTHVKVVASLEQEEDSGKAKGEDDDK